MLISNNNCCLLILMIIIYTYILIGYSDKKIEKEKYDRKKTMLLLIITILTSIIEEFIFRYMFWINEEFIFKYMFWINENKAIISSSIFCAYHINNLYDSENFIEIIFKYLFQFVAGYNLYLLKSLYLSCVYHIILNIIPLLLCFYRYKIIKSKKISEDKYYLDMIKE